MDKILVWVSECITWPDVFVSGAHRCVMCEVYGVFLPSWGGTVASNAILSNSQPFCVPFRNTPLTCSSVRAGRMNVCASKVPWRCCLWTTCWPAISGLPIPFSLTARNRSLTTWLRPTSCWGWRMMALCFTPWGRCLFSWMLLPCSNLKICFWYMCCSHELDLVLMPLSCQQLTHICSKDFSAV